MRCRYEDAGPSESARYPFPFFKPTDPSWHAIRRGIKKSVAHLDPTTDTNSCASTEEEKNTNAGHSSDLHQANPEKELLTRAGAKRRLLLALHPVSMIPLCCILRTGSAKDGL